MPIAVEVLSSPAAVAAQAADYVAACALAAIETRGRFVMAVSGGSTPWAMLRALAERDLPWPQIYLAQVDERVAPAGHDDRNLTHLIASLDQAAGFSAEQLCPMPVEVADLETAAEQYSSTLTRLIGSPSVSPPVLDLVHLGLGTDGHTASLVPGDEVLNVQDRWVAATGEYQGRRRLTLTYPTINNARQILWLVTGESKAPMQARLLAADATIPAGRVSQSYAQLFTDKK